MISTNDILLPHATPVTPSLQAHCQDVLFGFPEDPMG
jgi:hypothetical protein